MLKNNEQPTCAKIKRYLESLDVTGSTKISTRTIRRDIDYLRDECTAPIEFCFSKKYYSLTDPTWTWEAPFIDRGQMRASIIGARLAETLLPKSIRSEIRSAVDDLMVVNESDLSENAALKSLITSVCKVDIDSKIFAKVFRGWEERRSIKVKYKSANGTQSTLEIEPHILTLHDQIWYIKGHLLKVNSHKMQDKGYPKRIYALHRIQSIEVLTGQFQTDSQLIEEVDKGKLFDYETIDSATIHYSPSAAPYVREQHPADSYIDQSDGSLNLTLKNEPEYKLIRLVLAEAGEAAVLSPQWLADQLIDKANTVLNTQMRLSSGGCEV